MKSIGACTSSSDRLFRTPVHSAFIQMLESRIFPLCICFLLLASCHLALSEQEDPMGKTCGTFWDDVIDEQLDPYKAKGISLEDMTAGPQYANFGFRDVAEIKVVDGEVYLKMHVDGPRIVEYTAYWIKSLLCSFKLPDFQLTLEASGFQYTPYNELGGNPPPPVFSYNRHRAFNHFSIMLPYQLVGGHRDELRRIYEPEPWEQRLPVAVWRGTTTGDYPVNKTTVLNLQRTQICMACKELGPQLCDAKFTSVVQARNQREENEVWELLKEMGLTGEFVTKEEIKRYKFTMLPDGNVAPTSRSINGLQTGSLIMKSVSMWEEFWYRKLIPYYHYVPLPQSAHEMNSTLQWLRFYDQTAKRIAENGREFALKYLTVEYLECYVARLLTKYASLLKFKPTIADNEKQGFKKLELWMRRDKMRQITHITGCNNWSKPI